VVSEIKLYDGGEVGIPSLVQEAVAGLYCKIFNGYTEGEQHTPEQVLGRLKSDMGLGTTAVLATLEGETQVGGFLWAWMGLEKDEFVGQVTTHAVIGLTEEASTKTTLLLKAAFAGLDMEWEKTIYVPEMAIDQKYRGVNNYQRMVGELAKVMTNAGSQKFMFWVQKDNRAYELFKKTLGAELIVEIPGDRALMMGSSQEVYKKYKGSLENANAS